MARLTEPLIHLSNPVDDLDCDIDFTLSRCLSFAGKPSEQHIMILPDGCGIIVEFKSQPRERVFAMDVSLSV